MFEKPSNGLSTSESTCLLFRILNTHALFHTNHHHRVISTPPTATNFTANNVPPIAFPWMPEVYIQNSASLHQIVALFAESVCYGLYLCSCGFCLVALLIIDHPPRWRKWSEMRWVMLLAWFVLLVNASLNLALGVYRDLEAFVFSNDPEMVFKGAGTWVNLAKVGPMMDSLFVAFTKDFTQTITTLIQPLIGDLVLIYRSYVVYSHQYIVVIPSIIFWIANVAMAGRAVQLQKEIVNGTINNSVVTPWLIAFWTLTVCQTLYTTCQ